MTIGKGLTYAKIWRGAEASILSHCFFNLGRRYARQQQKTGIFYEIHVSLPAGDRHSSARL
ncbi:TPA: hypothetical protein MIQ56_25600 [Klebsiella pneumoniae]|nr:hypothetical protein DMP60_14850 [Klebsiella pneumoniae]HBY1532715.1 hypothetical protein [Klebsiella pneumoniae]HBY1579342.1 hypothetical protein [Klebsiella pneumoniae]HBY1616504.1 hypothetical protein [Klebsiella pneumoniae]HBY1639194.1 hypothetical protein [Klebsiella pneumoniae]